MTPSLGGSGHEAEELPGWTWGRNCPPSHTAENTSALEPSEGETQEGWEVLRDERNRDSSPKGGHRDRSGGVTVLFMTCLASEGHVPR